MLKALLILHMIGLCAGVGTSMFMATLTLRLSGTPDTENMMVSQHAFKAAILGEIGLVLLIVSGLGMAALNPAFMDADLFWSKMVMVVLLTVFLALLRRTGARIHRGELHLASKMPFLGIMALVLSLVVVITSVLAFG